MSNEVKKQQTGAKFQIIGMSGSGKSTALLGLKDAFVIYTDTKKKFPLNIPHTNVYAYKEFVSKKDGKTINSLPDKAIEYRGIAQFKKDIIGKLGVYAKAKGRLPATIAFDTSTNLYKFVHDYIKETTTNVYGSHSADTASAMDDFMSWIERTFIAKGINVVLLAHAIDDADGNPKVATSGSKTFENVGGFFGASNYSSYIYVKDGARWVSHKDLAYAGVSRSMLTDIDDFEEAENFNIEDMVQKIRNAENKSEDNCF